MILIGSSADQSGNGMFSASARKLNMMFLNLKERTTLIPNNFVNNLARSKSQPPIRGQERGEEGLQLQPVIKKKKTVFEGGVSREKLAELEKKKVSTPFYGNYNPKLVGKKIKVLRNYLLENPEADFKTSLLGSSVTRAIASRPNEFRIEALKSETGHRRASYVKATGRKSSTQRPLTELRQLSGLCDRYEREKAPLEPVSNPRGVRIPAGLVELDRQTFRMPNVKQSYFEPSNDLTETYSSLKRKPCNAGLTFRPQTNLQRFEGQSMHRNNYELEIKRVLVQKRTDLLVPDFERDNLRRPQTCRDACLNKGFYDRQFPDRYTRSPDISKYLGR